MKIKYMRNSGTTIELEDTPNMKAFAEKQGWNPVIKSSSKKSKEDLIVPTFAKKKKRKK